MESSRQYLETKLNEKISLVEYLEETHNSLLNENEIFNDAFYEDILTQTYILRDIEILSTEDNILYSSLDNENREALDLSAYEVVEDGVLHEVVFGDVVHNQNSDEFSIDLFYRGEKISILAKISLSFFEDYGAT